MPRIEPVTAAGGVVYKLGNNNTYQVVLIFRRGVWDLPKGKLEEGETIEECASREVSEEIGLRNLPKITHTLADTYHEYEESGTFFGKTTHWFGMKVAGNKPNEFEPETEEGIEQVQWFPLPEAKKRVGYDNLVDVLTSFEELVIH